MNLTDAKIQGYSKAKYLHVFLSDWGKKNKMPVSQSGEERATLSPPDVQQSTLILEAERMSSFFWKMSRPKNHLMTSDEKCHFSVMLPPYFPSGKNKKTKIKILLEKKNLPLVHTTLNKYF